MKKLLLFLCLSSGVILRAQIFPGNGELITTRNGLPHNLVLSVLEDRQGFLWIGTFNGLCRYDGSEYRTYREELTSAEGGMIYAIEKIFEDSKGQIWVATRGGQISCLNKKTGIWKRFAIRPGNIHVAIVFCEDHSGRIWVGTRDGYLGWLSENSGTFEYTRIANAEVSKLAPVSDSSLLLLSGYIYFIHTGSFCLRKYDSGDLVEQTGTGTVRVRRPTPLVYGDTLFLFDKNRVSESALQREFHEGQNIRQAKSGEFFTYDPANIYEYTLEGKLLNKISLGENCGISLSGQINEVSSAGPELIWVASNIGLLKINRDALFFKVYSSTSQYFKTVDNYARSLYYHDKTLWIGYRKGLIAGISFDEKTRKPIEIRYYSPDPQNVKITINCFLAARSGDLYAGGAEGLFVKRKGDKEFRKLFLPNSITECWSLLEDRQGWIWVGRNMLGLSVFNPRTEETFHYPRLDSSNRFAPWTMYSDRNGQTWVGSNLGLFIAESTAGHDKIAFKRHPRKELQLPWHEVWQLHLDKEDNLWVGTTNYGLSRINIHSGNSISFTTKNGLASNVISGFLFDRDSMLWVSTVNGIHKIPLNGGKIINYTEDDGILSNDFNFKALTAAPWGELFFGSKAGVLSFSPQNLKSYSKPGHESHITSVKLFNNAFSDSTVNSGELDLRYDQNYLTFRFALLELVKPKEHRYRYKLLGLENEWHYTTAGEPVAMYTGLPHGSYTLALETSLDGTHWIRKNSAMLKIKIHPAYWQSNWFRILLVLAISFLLVFFIYSRLTSVIAREREKNQINRKFAELEMKSLRAQMNPHFIFNSINAIQHYIIKKDVVAANDYLSRFARLMRFFLESSKNNYVILQDELDMMGLYLSIEKLRFNERFDYSIRVAEDIDPSQIEIPGFLLQPFLENATNHGLAYKKEKGYLELSLKIKDDRLHCIIEDDGVGRKKAAEMRNVLNRKHPSRGMELIADRLEILSELENERIEIKITDKEDANGNGIGTRVDILIPVNNS